MIPRIDVLVVLHNSRRLIPALLAGLKRISIPFNLYFIDNGSSDGTPEEIASQLHTISATGYLSRSLNNNGFARGMNLLSRMSQAEYILLLNPDAELQEGCLERLLARIESDPTIGMCEARQSPREHPKNFDPQTGRTSWCSGAVVLIRREAFEQAGRFDEDLYFMYCEDIDLSWKIWLKGWSCVYERNAVAVHLTGDLVSGKKRTLENYFDFRNSLFLFYRFGSMKDWRIPARFMVRRFLTGPYSVKSRILFGIAFVDHIRYIPHLLQTRDIWSRAHPWIRFEETSLSR